MISPLLIPPGVNDARNRDFIATLSACLADFKPSTLIVQDAWTAPAALLPIMVVENALSDFVSADMREDVVRSLIDAAPEIHAMTGTVAGARRALAALGITVRWTQWFQATPKAHHNTHKVVLYFADTVIDGAMPLDIPNQRAAARVIAATVRHSQDIAIQYGMRGQARVFAGASQRRSRTVRINAPRLGNLQSLSPIFVGIGWRTVRTVRVNQSTGGSYPVLWRSSVPDSDASIGSLIATVTVSTRPYPRIMPTATSTDAAIGDIVGTINAKVT